MRKWTIFALLGSLLIWGACSTSQEGLSDGLQAPDYASADMWYGAETPTHEVDLFYVYPTLGTMPVDEQGNRLYFTDVYDSEYVEAAHANQRYFDEVYAGEEYNFYSPLYRQMTIEHFIPDQGDYRSAMTMPLGDVREAFDYYMEHLNGGRPFILMSHSQGTLLLIELLKEYVSEQQLEQLVVAYLMGFPITSEELNSYPTKLKPAQGAGDVGVVVSFNSFTDVSAVAPPFAGSGLCINPINWATDGTVATAEEHLGAIHYDATSDNYTTIPHYTGGYTQDNVMICTDVNPSDYYLDGFDELFPLGCLHLMESSGYACNIQANMALRSANYLQQ